MQPPGEKRRYETIVTDILNALQNGGLLTDVNPGSVVRTLTEAFALEMAEAYERLNVVYEMGYIDTATDESLNHLVALLGQERIKGMQVVGEAVFERDTRVVGRAVIPEGTTMSIGPKTYVTTTEAELKPGQAYVTVPIRAEVPPGRQPAEFVVQAHEVGAVTLTYPLAGVAGASIARPTAVRGHTETDADLRRRVKGLITAAGGGTLKAMERAILATGKARSVLFRDADTPGNPVLLPGELEVVIDGDLDNPDAFRAIKNAIYESKGPGILVRLRGIQTVPLSFRLKLQLAGSNISPERRQAIRREVELAVHSTMEALGVGQKLLWNPLQAKILQVDGVLDLETAEVSARLGDFEAPQREVPVSLNNTDRLTLPDDRPAVMVTFGDEARVYVQVAVGAEPQAAERAVLARTLDDLLRIKNQPQTLGAPRTLSYADVVDALRQSSAGQVVSSAAMAVLITQESGGGTVELKAGGPAYTLGADERFFADPSGFVWGRTT
ncbi:MAG TPA: baseplate J/gp47 family protein [Symbiobacteriaceae bacterium]|nr:baseplate J/gp47 family protein [Symbiobacteriaceae bacterium]